jgi:hypothetical protein
VTKAKDFLTRRPNVLRGLAYRARKPLAARARLLADRLDGKFSVTLDYPTTALNRPRYGYGQEPHRALDEIIRRNDQSCLDALESILRYRVDLRHIAPASTSPGEPFWRNDFLPALDSASIYAFMRERRPQRYIEVGSGHSTRFAARAKRDGGMDTQITSIDPEPRAEIEGLCDRIFRSPLELADLEIFAAVQPGDVLFVDGSHRVFMNSDVAVFFLDVLPRLPSGVLVGIHDIYLPDDYDPWEAEDYYSEQYLLAMALLYGESRLQTIFPADSVGKRPELRSMLDPLWAEPTLVEADHWGCAFWLQVR